MPRYYDECARLAQMSRLQCTGGAWSIAISAHRIVETRTTTAAYQIRLRRVQAAVHAHLRPGPIGRTSVPAGLYRREPASFTPLRITFRHFTTCVRKPGWPIVATYRSVNDRTQGLTAVNSLRRSKSIPLRGAVSLEVPCGSTRPNPPTQWREIRQRQKHRPHHAQPTKNRRIRRPQGGRLGIACPSLLPWRSLPLRARMCFSAFDLIEASDRHDQQGKRSVQGEGEEAALVPGLRFRLAAGRRGETGYHAGSSARAAPSGRYCGQVGTPPAPLGTSRFGAPRTSRAIHAIQGGPVGRQNTNPVSTPKRDRHHKHAMDGPPSQSSFPGISCAPAQSRKIDAVNSRRVTNKVNRQYAPSTPDRGPARSA